MKVIDSIECRLMNLYDKACIFRMKRRESKKFQDERRKVIYEKSTLTKKQKKEVDDLYKKNYGKKIPYIWHKHYTAFTGNFDKNYFPELLYIPEFEYYMNFNESYTKVYSNKNVLPLIAKNIDIKMPKTIICCDSGIYRDTNNNVVKKENLIQILYNVGECFIKPTIDSCSGQGCRLLDIINGIDKISNENVESILESLGKDYVIQEKIKCHESISKIYDKSVNTFRIMTYRWKDDILHVPVIMRIGQGGNYLDNAHAGGMFVAIEDDGRLHETAFTEFKKEYKIHPDSKIEFMNYKIEVFPQIINDAKKMHALIPQVGVINWDFTIDREGKSVLIEANQRSGGIWVFEMAWGKGPFGNYTEEILRWIKLMKKTKVEERYKYAWGNMEGEKK